MRVDFFLFIGLVKFLAGNTFEALYLVGTAGVWGV